MDPQQPRTLRLAAPRMHGPDVAEVQRLLGIDDDGEYGPVTAEAVAAWKRSRGERDPSGELDPPDRRILLRDVPLRAVRLMEHWATAGVGEEPVGSNHVPELTALAERLDVRPEYSRMGYPWCAFAAFLAALVAAAGRLRSGCVVGCSTRCTFRICWPRHGRASPGCGWCLRGRRSGAIWCCSTGIGRPATRLTTSPGSSRLRRAVACERSTATRARGAASPSASARSGRCAPSRGTPERPVPRTGERTGLKTLQPVADDPISMDAAERKAILSRYVDHSRRFDQAAARRSTGTAEVIPFQAPLKELEQEPTAREIEVLQLISEGLVNREIGKMLFLSEETVKSHVRHLLAKLQARSRAHAVAVGFRRGLLA